MTGSSCRGGNVVVTSFARSREMVCSPVRAATAARTSSVSYAWKTGSYRS